MVQASLGFSGLGLRKSHLVVHTVLDFFLCVGGRGGGGGCALSSPKLSYLRESPHHSLMICFTLRVLGMLPSACRIHRLWLLTVFCRTLDAAYLHCIPTVAQIQPFIRRLPDQHETLPHPKSCPKPRPEPQKYVKSWLLGLCSGILGY